jgi:hypothetical protein
MVHNRNKTHVIDKETLVRNCLKYQSDIRRILKGLVFRRREEIETFVFTNRTQTWTTWPFAIQCRTLFEKNCSCYPSSVSNFQIGKLGDILFKIEPLPRFQFMQ